MSYGNPGIQLKNNMMNGVSTRSKSWSDYTAYPIPPCGSFMKPGLSRSMNAAPWLQHPFNSSYQSLDQEIEQFMKYMEPTAQEAARRKDLVKRFTNLIASFEGKPAVQPVGSYVTGLYLPSSDIDMVLTFRDTSFYGRSVELRRILHKIERSGFASQVKDVLQASVPLIRITDKITGIEIDLTASDTHGIRATEAVQKWMQGETEIKKMLITVVKMFLSIRRCGTTYTGGINSYVLVWMVVAWVSIEWPKIKSQSLMVVPDESSLISSLERLSIQPSGAARLALHKMTLRTRTSESAHPIPTTVHSNVPHFGRALRGFFKFYGYTFQYSTEAIKIKPTPSYTTKIIPYSRYANTQRYLLSIFDPADDSIDMGSKAYGIKHIQASFREAYNKLSDARTKTRGERITAFPDGLLAHVLDGDFTQFVAGKKAGN